MAVSQSAQAAWAVTVVAVEIEAMRGVVRLPLALSLVAEAMRVMKYVNKFNRVVTRVQEMLKDNGNPPAEFDVNTITAFRVNVHATNESDLSKGTSQGTSQGISQGISQDDKTIEEKIIEFCKEPRSLAEITKFCGFKDKRKFRERYLSPNNSRDLSATS